MIESTAAYEKALKAIAKDRQLDMISKKDKETLVKIAKLMQKANESVNEVNKAQLKKMIKMAKKSGAKGYDIVKSIADDLGVSPDEVVSDMERYRWTNQTEDNKMKESKFKSQLREVIRKALIKEEGSVADEDMKTAVKLKKPLKNAIEGVSNSVDKINQMMSNFNAPGLRVAFLYAIKKNINTQTQKFDMRSAMKDFEDYYKDR